MRTDKRIDKMSEQELDAYTERLLRQVEAEGLIPAPAHMKQEILERSRSLDYQIRVQTRQIPKKLQFLYYSLKVGAAVVMALFLVLMVKDSGPDNRYGPNPKGYSGMGYGPGGPSYGGPEAGAPQQGYQYSPDYKGPEL